MGLDCILHTAFASNSIPIRPSARCWNWSRRGVFACAFRVDASAFQSLKPLSLSSMVMLLAGDIMPDPTPSWVALKD